MPTSTYIPIAHITLSSNVSMISFTGITQSYRDLVLTSSMRVATSGVDAGLAFNSSSTSGSEHSRLYAAGSASSAFTGSNYGLGAALFSYPDNVTQTDDVVHIMDYTATDKHKSWVCHSSLPNNAVVKYGGRWANMSAITAIYIINTGGTTFTAGSTFALYGIVA
jgi:hypothetical protein